MKTIFVLIILLASTVKLSSFNDIFNLSYDNSHVRIIKDYEPYKNRIIYEKLKGLPFDSTKHFDVKKCRGCTNKFFIDIIENIDKPIKLLYNKIKFNFEVVSIDIYIREAKQNNIQYVYSMCFDIDYNEDYWMLVDVDIDYGYSLPFQYSDTVNITKLIDEILTSRVRNINQLAFMKPIPVPDAEESDLPDSLNFPNWDDIFRNKEK